MTTLRSFLVEGQSSKSVVVAPPLPSEHRSFWPVANKEILWGWKRDAQCQSRVVYFSGRLEMLEQGISVADSFFFYQHKTNRLAADLLGAQLTAAIAGIKDFLAQRRLEVKSLDRSSSIVRFKFGVPRTLDLDRVTRLLMRRPRRKAQTSTLPSTEPVVEAVVDLLPADVYLGSGVSYEAGLPTLCEVHDYFCLDNRAETGFTFGVADELPAWLEKNPLAVLKNFCSLHTKALVAPPTPAQRFVAELWSKGLVRQVLSDNVDNLLCKVNVPFERTRGSGVFNERFPVRFLTRALLVVGVAADRREIIRQARGKRMQVIVVDPCAKVSHGVQHLNFLRSGDVFFRLTAEQFFGRLYNALRARSGYGV